MADEGLVEHLEMLQKKQTVVSLVDAFKAFLAVYSLPWVSLSLASVPLVQS